MGVRINKVLSELNIGFETAVEFLKKRIELGEVKDDATPNTKISDKQYDALVSEFSTDKAVKTKAEQLFTKKVKEKKAEKKEKAVAPTDELLEHRQQFKAVGKIDLESLNKPKSAAPAEPVEEPQPVVAEEVVAPAVTAAEPQKEEPVITEPEAPEPEPAAEPEKEAEEQEATAETTAVEASEEEPTPQQTSLAKTPGDLKAAQNAPQLNVLGKIDLSTLNQSTRPKKKSKEERRKEREEKAAGERKKRERIRQGKVDIEAAAKQASKDSNKNDKNKNNNRQQQNQQQGGKKNKKGRQPQKPLEVDDEAVARQVKETLARLTSKSQNKKGAKYRREKRDAVQERMSEEMAAEAAQSKVLKLTEFVTVSHIRRMSLHCRATGCLVR